MVEPSKDPAALEAVGDRPRWPPPVYLLTGGAHVATFAALTVAVVTSTGNHHAALLCAVLSGAGTLLTTRRPCPGFVLTAAVPLFAVVAHLDPLIFWTVTVFTTFAVTVRGLPAPVTAPVACLTSLAAEALATGTVSVHANPVASIAGFCALMSALAGSSVRAQHRYWLAVRQRTLDAVATRESLVRRSVAEERVRIARDLHDSVGHHIAVLSMHLGAAEVNLPTGSDVPLGHLRNARGSVQDVLAEVQQILAVLRLETGADDLVPTPELSHVSELVASFRNAGLDLEEHLTGCDLLLPHDVSAAAYRIAQEALTNAQKHGTHGVRFTVHADEETVRIEVVNTMKKTPGAQAGTRSRTTPSTSAGRGGRGLVGVGERAESVGGRIEFHEQGGLFSFRAELPVHGGRA